MEGCPNMVVPSVDAPTNIRAPSRLMVLLLNPTRIVAKRVFCDGPPPSPPPFIFGVPKTKTCAQPMLSARLFPWVLFFLLIVVRFWLLPFGSVSWGMPLLKQCDGFFPFMVCSVIGRFFVVPSTTGRFFSPSHLF